MMQTKSRRSFSVTDQTRRRDIFLFTFNTVSSNAALGLMSFYMFFTQNVLGLLASAVGIIATAMRIWDGVTDPLIGVLIDRTDGRYGKFRPYIALGYIIMAIPMILIFYTPESWANGQKYLWTIFWYAVYIIGYTFQTTSTRAAQAILTKDPKQRPLFAQYQMITNGIMNAFFSLLLSTLMAPRYEKKMLDPQLWKDLVWIYVAVMGISTLLAILGIRRRDVRAHFDSSGTQKAGFADMLRVLRGNRALQMLVVAASTDKLAMMVQNTFTVYIFSNLLLNNKLSGLFSLVTMAPSILLSVMLVQFARRWGQKTPLVRYTAACMGIVLLMLLVGARRETLWIFLTLMALRNVLTQTITGLMNPLIADCADYETWRSGRFVPGIVGTIFTFVDKCVSAFGTTIAGFALVLAGVGGQKLPTDTWISDRFYWTMMVMFTLPLFLGQLATLLAMRFYPLTREKMAEIQADLQARKRLGREGDASREAEA